jgi:alpha-ketoglutarate-dependent 2,4-dichlorophenoxyacetate dioxygenase
MTFVPPSKLSQLTPLTWPDPQVKPYLALGRKNRFAHDEIFDVSNLEDDGSIAQLNTKRYYLGQGNTLFHVDSSFNPRRAGFSLLRAHTLPPRGTGGNTDFADARRAFDDLDEEVKEQLVREDYVACHSLWWSRKCAAPGQFDDVDVYRYPFGRHKLVQRHEGSGRTNLYVAAHVHHLERRRGDGEYEEVQWEEGRALIDKLMKHATRRENVLSVEWKEEGDLVVWDNTCVMHRAGEGSFAGKYVRDMRRCTVHDGSIHAWGLNEIGGERMGLP